MRTERAQMPERRNVLRGAPQCAMAGFCCKKVRTPSLRFASTYLHRGRHSVACGYWAIHHRLVVVHLSTPCAFMESRVIKRSRNPLAEKGLLCLQRDT
jgi:hypothetical protein